MNQRNKCFLKLLVTCMKEAGGHEHTGRGDQRDSQTYGGGRSRQESDKGIILINLNQSL